MSFWWRAFIAVVCFSASSAYAQNALTFKPTLAPIIRSPGQIEFPNNLKLQNKFQTDLKSVTDPTTNTKLPQTQIVNIDTNIGSSIYQLSLRQAFSVRAIARPFDPDTSTLSEREKALIGGRILLGDRVQTGQFPWQVAFLNSVTGNIFCGGSHIGEGWIVTAAHCFWDNARRTPMSVDNFVVMYGSLSLVDGGKRTFPLANPIIHEAFDPTTLSNDIAIVRINPTTTIPLAPFTTADDSGYLVPTKSLLVTGWGQTTAGGNISVDLLQAAVPVADLASCRTAYNGLFPITDNQFCAGATSGSGPDTCKGDSGGPISFLSVAENKRLVLGITSFGEGCGNATHPGVYTRIKSYLQWVEAKTGHHF